MKKFLFFMLLLFFLFNLNYEKNVETVIGYTDETYGMYELVFDAKQLSTTNIINYFEEIKVISIKPFINEIYINKFNLKSYKFNQHSIKKDIEIFKKQYLKFLEINGYKKDILKCDLEGIYIKSVIVYENIKNIEILKHKLNFKIYQK